MIDSARFRALSTLALIVTVLTGCAGATPIDPEDPNRALVFGYIDMENAPSDLDWVKVRRYKPMDTNPYRCGVEDGLFWHLGVKPGSYQVEDFGGNGGLLGGTNYRYDFATSGRNPTAVRIREPGIYFLGAYRYVHEEGDRMLVLFSMPDKFSMERIDSPSERELLERLLERMESDGNLNRYHRQIGWIKQRLDELS